MVQRELSDNTFTEMERRLHCNLPGNEVAKIFAEHFFRKIDVDNDNKAEHSGGYGEGEFETASSNAL